MEPLLAKSVVLFPAISAGSLPTIVSTTRRFALRPSGVELGSTGRNSPKASTDSLWGATPLSMSRCTTLAARAAESSQLDLNCAVRIGTLSVWPSTWMLFGNACSVSPSRRITGWASVDSCATPEANRMSDRMETSTKPSPVCTSTRPCAISGLMADSSCCGHLPQRHRLLILPRQLHDRRRHRRRGLGADLDGQRRRGFARGRRH